MTLFYHEPTAFDPLLNRAEALGHVEEYFPEIPRTLAELVDYGTHLIPRCYNSSGKALVDIISIAVLLKQAIAMLDGAQLLIAGGAVQPALLQLRAMFEVSVFLDWTLATESESRARAYYVWNLRRGRMWALRALQGTPEAEALENDLAGLSVSGRLQGADVQAQAAKQLAHFDEQLAAPENAHMNSLFDDRRGRRLFDADWYAVLFPRRERATLRTLCEQVGRLPEYQLIYELGSEAMHSRRTDVHFRVTEGKLGFRSLRELTDIGLVAQLLIGQAIHTYGGILRNYRPQERENFARKYSERWRSILLSKKSVQYEYIERPID